MMTRSVFPIITILILMQTYSNSQDNVGIGTLTPAYRLDVQGNAASTSLINFNSKVNYVGNLDIRAVEGYSITNPGYGIGGKFTAGYKGVEGICQGGNYSGIILYGVYGSAAGTAGTRVGTYGTAAGGSVNYG